MRRPKETGVASWRLVLAVLVLVCATALLGGTTSWAAELADTIKRIKGSVVGIGTHQVTRRPPSVFKATGFVVGDGKTAITNHHAIVDDLDDENREQLSIFVRVGEKIQRRKARIVKQDPKYDVAVLKFDGPALPALELSKGPDLPEGKLVAFTGFPIGTVLGLYPVTHRGIISAYTPIAIPQRSHRQLDTKMIQQLQDRFFVYQLDATAYPGNSGSPLYDPSTGMVHGIVSIVFVKDSRERILQDPSGISYAIPIRHAVKLLE